MTGLEQREQTADLRDTAGIRFAPSNCGGKGDSAERERVVYVIDSLHLAGAERHLVRLIDGMSRESGWHLSVFCLDRRGPLVEAIEDLGVEVVGPEERFSASPAHIFRTFFSLWRYLRHERPAIVHCHLLKASLVGGIAARLAGVRSVVSTRHQEHHFAGLHWLLYRLTTTLADLSSQMIIAVCEAVKDQVVREGTSDRKIVTIYNSVPDHPSTRLRCRQFEGSPIFASCSRLHPSKGHRYMVEAIPRVLERLPDARFVFAGGGVERDALERQATALGVHHRVTFLGQRGDVPDLWCEFDIFVLPSLREGFPTVVLEAMAAGVPVVATRVGGVGEVVRNGSTGLLIESGSAPALAEAMVGMWENESLRQTCAEGGRDLVSREFAVAQELSQTLGVYRELLDRPKA